MLPLKLLQPSCMVTDQLIVSLLRSPDLILLSANRCRQRLEGALLQDILFREMFSAEGHLSLGKIFQ